MEIGFTKMEGLGNDYVYVDVETYPVLNPSELAIKVSDRHFGIGSDGLVLIGKSKVADFSMRIFNADGSEAMMCGNASRCIGCYVHEKGLTNRTEITLETRSGVRTLKLNLDDSGKLESVSVDMGTFSPINVPGPVSSKGRIFMGHGISMGNPHYVIFTDEDTIAKAEVYGPEIEVADAFPDRTNVEFARFVGSGKIRMRVWERGSGITMACGTGACATASAAVLAGLADSGADIIMDGGTLHVTVDRESGNVTMTGPAEITFEGMISII